MDTKNAVFGLEYSKTLLDRQCAIVAPLCNKNWQYFAML